MEHTSGLNGYLFNGKAEVNLNMVLLKSGKHHARRFYFSGVLHTSQWAEVNITAAVDLTGASM
jgi:hypothetical protein